MKRYVMVPALALVLLSWQALNAEKKDQPTSDADFLTRAVVAGVCEVKLSEYAATHASEQKVKDLAKQLCGDHEKANAKLTEYARALKLAVVAGQEKETREKLDKLSKLKGEEFDREFLKQMIEDHQKAIRLFEGESKTGTDSGLKTFASDTLPTLRKHLEEARTLLEKIKK